MKIKLKKICLNCGAEVPDEQLFEYEPGKFRGPCYDCEFYGNTPEVSILDAQGKSLGDD